MSVETKTVTAGRVPFLDLQAVYREDAAAYDAAYRRVMDSGRWILGPEGEAFEQAFAAHCGRRHAVGVGNGLDALTLTLKAAGIGPGDEVLVPAHTFIATWLAVAECGATPRAVEPAEGEFCIDAAGVAAAITPQTRAVIPVHLYGEPADPAAIADLCADRGLVMISDAAQAQGAQWGAQSVGAYGLAACYSFYPGKNLGAFGDAGAVVTDDDALAFALRERRNYGSRARYAHESLGVNSRLDELQAAFLSVRLSRLDEHNARRQHCAAIYARELQGLSGLLLPAAALSEQRRTQSAWHLFVVRCAGRDALSAHLAAQGIDTLVHYPRPVYRFAPFSVHGPANRTVSDGLCDEILSLPIGPHLSDAQVLQVCGALQAFFD